MRLALSRHAKANRLYAGTIPLAGKGFPGYGLLLEVYCRSHRLARDDIHYTNGTPEDECCDYGLSGRPRRRKPNTPY